MQDITIGDKRKNRLVTAISQNCDTTPTPKKHQLKIRQSKMKRTITTTTATTMMWRSANCPLVGNPSTKCIINITAFVGTASQELRTFYQRKWALGGLQKLQRVDKIIASDFLVEKRSRKICLSTTDTVIKSLISLGAKLQIVIQGKVYFMWDVRLHTLPAVKTPPVEIL